MPVDTSMWQQMTQPRESLLDTYMKYKQLKLSMDAHQQEQQLRNLQIQQNQLALNEAQRQQAEAQNVRNAFAAAGQQGVTSQADVPGVNVGGVDVGGHTATVQGPGIDRNNLLNQLTSRGLGQQAMQYQQQFSQQDLQRQEALLTIRKNLGELDKTSLENVAKRNAQIGQALGTVMAAPPEQKAAVYAQARQALLQSTDPQIQQAASQAPPQYTPDIEPWLQQHAQQAMTVDQMVEQVRKAKEFNVEQSAKTVNTLGAVKQYDPATKTYKDTGIGKPASTAMMNGQLSLTPEATAMAAGLYSQTGQLPAGFGRSPQVTANVINKAAQLQPNTDIASNKIAYGGKKSTTTYFTSGAGGKQLTAFNTAITHLDTLDRLAGDLNNTDIQIANRAKQAWAEQTGNPAPANFAAAVNAMSGEVAAALKASGATDQEIAHVGATFDRSQSPAQLRGAIATYRELLNSKVQQLRKQYQAGMQGQPAFQQQGQGGVTVTDPRGVVHTFPSQEAANQFKAAAGIQQ